MIKIYVAAPFVHRGLALAAKLRLEDAGFQVTSRWITRESNLTNDDINNPAHFKELQTEALNDVADIVSADAFVILNSEKSEGKATELGIAFIRKMPVYLVGDLSRNIFYHLPGILRLDTLGEVMDHMELLEECKNVR